MKSNKKEKDFDDFRTILDDSKEDLSKYIEKRLLLIKLKCYEKITNFSSRILFGVVLAFLCLILSILSVVTFALMLGQFLNNYSAGFGITILVLIIIIILAIVNQRRIKRSFANLTLRIIKKIESDED